MNIKVTSCRNCPFFVTEWDEFCTSGPGYFYHCGYIVYDSKNKHVAGDTSALFRNTGIEFYKNGNTKSKNKKTLDNCPLLKENINIEL